MELVDKQGGRHIAQLQGAGDAHQPFPVAGQVLGVDLPGELEGGVSHVQALDFAQLLVADIAQAGREFETQQVEKGKHQVGIAGRVSGVFQDFEFRFVA